MSETQNRKLVHGIYRERCYRALDSFRRRAILIRGEVTVKGDEVQQQTHSLIGDIGKY